MAKRRKKSEIKAFHELVENRYKARHPEREKPTKIMPRPPVKLLRKGTARLVRPPTKPKPGKALNENGYYLTKGGKLEHREIYKATYGKIPSGWVVHHIDQCKTNNDPDNLVALPRELHNTLHDEMWRSGRTWTLARQFEYLKNQFRVLKLKPTRPW